KVDHRASSGDLCDPGDEQPGTSGRQYAGWNRPVTGRENAAANGGSGWFVITAVGTPKIFIFLQKPVAQAAIMLDRGRSSCRKPVPLPPILFSSVPAVCFLRLRPKANWPDRRNRDSFLRMPMGEPTRPRSSPNTPRGKLSIRSRKWLAQSWFTAQVKAPVTLKSGPKADLRAIFAPKFLRPVP